MGGISAEAGQGRQQKSASGDMDASLALKRNWRTLAAQSSPSKLLTFECSLNNRFNSPKVSDFNAPLVTSKGQGSEARWCPGGRNWARLLGLSSDYVMLASRGSADNQPDAGRTSWPCAPPAVWRLREGCLAQHTGPFSWGGGRSGKGGGGGKQWPLPWETPSRRRRRWS